MESEGFQALTEGAALTMESRVAVAYEAVEADRSGLRLLLRHAIAHLPGLVRVLLELLLLVLVLVFLAALIPP